jgi:hypothetical protein
VQDQQLTSEVQQVPDLTAEQELQQLQAQLQAMQQERDRVAAAYAANQQAAQTSTQAAEIRKQLAILQAKIQSMQPPQATATAPSQTPPPNQSLTNAAPTTAAPLTPVPPAQTSATRILDPRSPLSQDIQTSPWPVNYKPITLPKYNGRTDPRQFIMSFEAAVASAGGNDSVLAKSFVIAAEGDALAWYSMLKPSTIYS